MSAAPAGLFDLLLALFSDEAELRRFMALAGRDDALKEVRPSKGGGFTDTVYQVAAALEAGGRLDADLFRLLAGRAPERERDVWAAAADYGITPESPGSASDPAAPTPPPTPTSSTEAIPAEYGDFAAELASELAAFDRVSPLDVALDRACLPWTGAAAVLGSFWPTDLRPLPSDDPVTPSVFTALTDVVARRLDGRWVLEDAVRVAGLAKIHELGRLQAALDANRRLTDHRRDWIERLLAGELPEVVELDLDDLTDLGAVLGWLRPLGLGTQIEPATIDTTLQRRALVDPLRTLAGRGFEGRADELDKIDRHRRGISGHRDLVISGAGGVGKSSLVGKVLLTLEDRRHDPQPFAYIDFDRARNDPLDPVGLVRQVALQLRLLYATSVEATRELAALESVSAGTDVALALDILGAELGGGDLDGLVQALAQRVERLPRSPESPMLLVFDTFEEVQVRGEGAVDSVRSLVDLLAAALPELRVIVCGRGAVPEFATPGADWDIELGDLDPAAADAVLRNEHVADEHLRALIIDRFGSNPLTLRLASQAVNAPDGDDSFGDVFGEAAALAAVAVEQIQGMLYGRILGHLRDAIVAKVAYPGLVVRLVDVAIIRDVLAGPCGLDPAQAPDIFDRLRRHVALFSLDEHGALVHRQDVRRLMLRAMQDDPKHRGRALDIHRRAAAYYAARPGRQAVAEHVYHRLMSGDDPRAIDPLWTSDLQPLLASAWDEPLPAGARRWLGPRLGRADRSERGEWEQEEWEVDAASAAASWLASRQPDRALAVMRERGQRLEGSRLYALEVQALVALGNFDEAIAVLEAGMAAALSAGAAQLQLELAERAIDLHLARGVVSTTEPLDVAAVERAAALSSQLADLLDQPQRGIASLVSAVVGLAGAGSSEASEAAERLGASLERRFLAMPHDSLGADPRLVRSVLRAIGGDSPASLARAAIEMGDRTDVARSAFRDDAFALDRLLAALPDTARPALDQLAADVGLSGADWTSSGLARAATRYGRTGRAVLLALDHAADQRAVCRQIVADLVRSPDEGFAAS